MNFGEALKKSKSLLYQISESQKYQKNKSSLDVDEALNLCFQLSTAFHNSFTSNGAPDITLKDSALIRAIIEIIVRWGISPFLDQGIGIHRDNNPNSKTLKDYDGLLLKSCETLLSFSLHETSTKHPFSVAFLVRNHYLPDIIAGFLQVAHGEMASHVERRSALNRLEQVMKQLSIGEMVETLLSLLLQKQSCSPPSWFSCEVGKLLSRLVMMDSGIPAVMQRLLGEGVKGDVMAYQRVASHLAKIPLSVATIEEYYKAVCPQLIPFLIDKKYGRVQAGESESAQQTLRNIHHTTVLLACTMLVREPIYSETYLLNPILCPLVMWAECLPQNSTLHVRRNNKNEVHMTEKSIVESFQQIQSLLSAGHQNIEEVRKIILDRTKPLLSSFLLLHYLFETSPLSKSIWAITKSENSGLHHNKMNQMNRNAYNEGTGYKEKLPELKSSRSTNTGLCKGFLDRGHLERYDDEEDNSNLGVFKSALDDLMIAHILDCSEELINAMSHFLALSDSDIRMFMWPSKEGELWDILNPHISRVHNLASYLSRFLLASEKWSLVVKLMGNILKRIAALRRALELYTEQHEHERNVIGSFPFSRIQQVMESFEILNDVVGSKALEQDLSASFCLIKDLFKDPTLSTVEDIVELMLHMVHSVLNGYKARLLHDALDQDTRQDLISISVFLEKFWKCFPSENIKRMSSTLNSRIISLLA